MKYVFVAALVAVLCWIGIARYSRANAPVATPAVPTKIAAAAVAKTPAPAARPTPVSTPPPPAVATRVEAVASAAPQPPAQPAAVPAIPGWNPNPSPFIEPSKPAGPPAPLPQIAMADVIGENNLYHDDAFGVSATYPQGWTVLGARRWGTNNSENTVTLLPDVDSTAKPSMYYQMYPNGFPEVEGPEAYFRRVAQNKENSRVGAMPDYKNLPGSFEFTEINGNPAMSYYAAYNRGNEVHTEFFIRILGKQGYVMFFVPGRMEDVQVIMPQLKQMARSVKVP